MPLRSLRTVAVGSHNPVKLAAARAILLQVAPHLTITGVAVPSGVAAQPMGDAETIAGARNRALAARTRLDADLGLGLEGGCIDGEAGMSTCAWAVVVDRAGRTGTGGSLHMPLPPRIAVLVREGIELGDAIDRLARTHGTKHGAGAVGILTAGLVDRQRAYEPLVAYALAPWLAPDWWG
jgi:inosine/xanthosine triphosphatase